MIASLIWLLLPLLYAVGALGFGTAFVYNETLAWHVISLVAGCLLPLRSVYYIVLNRKSGNRISMASLLQAATETMVALALIFLPHISYRAFVVFLLLYLSFYTAVKSMDAVIYKKNGVYQHFIPSLCQALFFLHLFVLLLLLPDPLRHPLLVWVSGFLLTLLGHTVLCEFLAARIRNYKVSQVFRRIMVTLPWVSGLSFPYRLIESIKHTDFTSNSLSDVEILFSYGKYGQGIAGHCELCLNGTTYTFGNYDIASQRLLKLTGNGILYCADREAHIDWMTQSGRTVIAYGLTPDAKQRRQIEQAVGQILAQAERWNPPNTPNDYLSQVQRAFSPIIYRITQGQFSTYFLPTINCVTLTCHFLQSTAAGHIFIPGIRTPGTYMDALHRLYLSENSMISYVKTYKKKK